MRGWGVLFGNMCPTRQPTHLFTDPTARPPTYRPGDGKGATNMLPTFITDIAAPENVSKCLYTKVGSIAFPENHTKAPPPPRGDHTLSLKLLKMGADPPTQPISVTPIRTTLAPLGKGLMEKSRGKKWRKEERGPPAPLQCGGMYRLLLHTPPHQKRAFAGYQRYKTHCCSRPCSSDPSVPGSQRSAIVSWAKRAIS